MKYIFKKMTPEGLKHSLAVFNSYILNSTAVWLTEKISLKQFREIISYGGKKYRSFTITAGGEFCGFCCFRQYNKRQGYDRTAELSIYLKPEFTGQGAGSAAIKLLEKQAKQTGVKVLIGSISGDNKTSVKLMKKFGYTKCGHFKKVGEKSGKILDVIYYQKIL